MHGHNTGFHPQTQKLEQNYISIIDSGNERVKKLISLNCIAFRTQSQSVQTYLSLWKRKGYM